MRTLKLICLWILPVLTVSTSACTVPVFRYALERWPAEEYLVLVAHRGPLEADARALIQQLEPDYEQPDLANLYLATVDLDDTKAVEWIEPGWLEPLGDAPLPQLIAIRPFDRAPVWRAPFTKDTLAALTSSPVRREVARRLLSGHSAVLGLFLSGDAQQDEAARTDIAAQVEQLNQDMELNPLALNPPEDDPWHRTYAGLPALGLHLSLITIPATDEEQVLRAMTLEQDGIPPEQPILAWFYGQGRILVVAEYEATEEVETALAESAFFLHSDCSCQVKSLNPGLDLLFPVNWPMVVHGEATVDEALGTVVPPPPPSTSSTRPRMATWGMLGLAAGVALVLGGVATVGLLRRSRRNPED